MSVLDKFINELKNIEVNVYLINGVTLSGTISDHDEKGIVIDGCYVNSDHYVSIAPKKK